MTSQVINRRQALMGAGVAGIGALAALAPTSALASGESADAIVGGWSGSASSPGLSFDILMTFSVGGGLTGSGSIDLSPQFLSTPVYGSWVKTGENTTGGNVYGLTVFFFAFKPDGTPLGKVKVLATATLSEATGKLSGKFEFFGITGTLELERIPVEPFP